MSKNKQSKQESTSALVDLFHTEQRKINDLIPFVGNPRSMTEHQVNSLKKSLKKFGVAELPVIDSDNVIVAGHQRLKALQDMGYGEVIIDVRVASRKLTDKEFQIYNIGSNKITGDFTDELFNFNSEILIEAGFTEEELEKSVNLDNSNSEIQNSANYIQKFSIVIDCENEEQQEELYQQLQDQGYKCKIKN